MPKLPLKAYIQNGTIYINTYQIEKLPQIAIAKRLLEGLRLLGDADPGFTVSQLRITNT